MRKLKPAMYTGLLHTHSSLRYLVLLLLLAVIFKSLTGFTGKKPFEKLDDKLSLFLLIFTHIQLVVGLILYFVSPFVQFGAQTMSDKATRYWTVEHIFGMLIAVVLITIARATSKRMTDPVAKHKRLFIFNLIALIIIVAMIVLIPMRNAWAV
ncbi:MAG TPA: cytochrome B [Ohtaekwangia sp.]|uniref:cytochrome B n=1 Tax=Ohtaekwangia sp. TaxID=2066019 RepID=UPI002F92C5D6